MLERDTRIYHPYRGRELPMNTYTVYFRRTYQSDLQKETVNAQSVADVWRVYEGNVIVSIDDNDAIEAGQVARNVAATQPVFDQTYAYQLARAVDAALIIESPLCRTEDMPAPVMADPQRVEDEAAMREEELFSQYGEARHQVTRFQKGL